MAIEPADIAPMFDIDEAVLQRAQAIKLAIFDVDGVLTNGKLYMGDDGQEYKAFNSRDGHGMKMLVANGVETAIITGRQSEVVKHRARDIHIKYLHQGALEKLPVYEQLISELGLTPEQTAFVGCRRRCPSNGERAFALGNAERRRLRCRPGVLRNDDVRPGQLCKRDAALPVTV